MKPGIAIVGASHDEHKFSHKAVKAYRQLGYTVYPVNPNYETIAGAKAYATLADLPGPVSEVSVYLPPSLTLAWLDEVKAVPLQKLYLNPGSADQAVRTKAKAMQLPVIEACSIRVQGLDPDDF